MSEQSFDFGNGIVIEITRDDALRFMADNTELADLDLMTNYALAKLLEYQKGIIERLKHAALEL